MDTFERNMVALVGFLVLALAYALVFESYMSIQELEIKREAIQKLGENVKIQVSTQDLKEILK